MSMSLLTKLGIAVVAGAVIAAGYGIHHSIYESGREAGKAEIRKENDDAREKAGRLNAQIEVKDQDLVVAKTEDKEKIVTIYKTIREQLDAQIVEVPVYRECRIPADGMRLIQQAATGVLQANPENASGGAAGKPASTER